VADQRIHEPSTSSRSRLRRSVPFLYLLLIAIALSAVHVARYTALSPIDELRHVDYAMRVSELELVKLGDKLGQESMREEACRGVDLPNYKEPPCNSRHFNPVRFRDKGYQTASAHPLTYYLGVGLVARAFVGVGVFDSFVDPARLMGGVLLGVGLCLVFAAGRRLGIRRLPLLAALTLLTTSSAVLHASTTVNPDATSILAGGIVMLAAVAWEQGRIRPRALVVAGVIATGLKFTNFLVILVVAAWLAARSEAAELLYARVRARWGQTDVEDPGDEPDDERPASVTVAGSDPAAKLGIATIRRDPFVRAGAYLVIGAFAAAFVWAVFDRVRATISPLMVPQNIVNAVHGIFPRWGFTFSPGHIFAWFPPLEGYDPFVYNPNIAYVNVRTLVTFLFVGAMLMALLRVRRRDSMSVLGAVGTVFALAAGPLFVLFMAVFTNELVDAGGRYGLSLLPVFVIVLASRVRGRVVTFLFSAFAVVAYITILATVAFADGPNTLGR
jgi:hypothetical protein